MSGKTLMAGLIGALVLGTSAIAAQAAPAPMSDAGARATKTNLVEKTHYRHHRHHHHWRYNHYRHHHYRHHHRHHR